MTLFLASVRNTDEAELVFGAGADIIDLKDPGKGALGALDLDAIWACVSHVDGRVPVSATVGDLPLEGTIVCDAVRAVASSGVNYVKLGLFPGGGARSCLSLLAEEARSVPLILVILADALPDFDAVEAAASIGAHGVMLDTAGKSSGSLLDYLSVEALTDFVAAAKAEGLSVGLAGSLSAKQVPSLLPLQPDLIGFRGALCRGGARDAALDPEACAVIRDLIPRCSESSIKPGLAA